MLGRVDWETRCQLPEASIELVEPTKKVVRATLEKLEKFGKLDTLPSDETLFGQYLFLRGLDNKFFEVYRVRFDASIIPDGRVRMEVKDRCGGLFIKGVQLDSDGNIVQRMPNIQAPQDPSEVTQENIYLLRGIFPSSMVRLAKDLKNSIPIGIPSKEFMEFFDLQ